MHGHVYVLQATTVVSVLHTIVDGQLQRYGVLASLCIGKDEGIVAACCIWMIRARPRIRLTGYHRRIGASHHC